MQTTKAAGSSCSLSSIERFQQEQNQSASTSGKNGDAITVLSEEDKAAQKDSARKIAEAARNRVLKLSIEPEYVRGNKPRIFGSKKWYQLKDDLKRTFIRTQWEQFLSGNTPEIATVELRKRMTETLNSQCQNPKMLADGQKYINKKIGNPQFGYNADFNTSDFWTKGTNLKSNVIRTQNGGFFQVVTEMSQTLRNRIREQQGKDYSGETLLGEGAFGQVKIAEKLDEEGSTVVAAKTSTQTIILSNESEILGKLPNSKHFTSVRDFAMVPQPGKNSEPQAYLFMDIEIRGHMASIIDKIALSSQLDVKEKEKLQRTIARQYVESVKEMHDNDLFHQDIKPTNFLLSKEGAVVLVDFGTASEKDGPMFAGTHGFLPPEAEGPESSMSAGDKYALGKTLWKLCQKVAGSTTDADSLGHIVANLTRHDPNERISLEEVLNSHYMQGEVYKDEELLSLVDKL